MRAVLCWQTNYDSRCCLFAQRGRVFNISQHTVHESGRVSIQIPGPVAFLGLVLRKQIDIDSTESGHCPFWECLVLVAVIEIVVDERRKSILHDSHSNRFHKCQKVMDVVHRKPRKELANQGLCLGGLYIRTDVLQRSPLLQDDECRRGSLPDHPLPSVGSMCICSPLR